MIIGFFMSAVLSAGLARRKEFEARLEAGNFIQFVESQGWTTQLHGSALYDMRICSDYDMVVFVDGLVNMSALRKFATSNGWMLILSSKLNNSCTLKIHGNLCVDMIFVSSKKEEVEVDCMFNPYSLPFKMHVTSLVGSRTDEIHKAVPISCAEHSVDFNLTNQAKIKTMMDNVKSCDVTFSVFMFLTTFLRIEGLGLLAIPTVAILIAANAAQNTLGLMCRERTDAACKFRMCLGSVMNILDAMDSIMTMSSAGRCSQKMFRSTFAYKIGNADLTFFYFVSTTGVLVKQVHFMEILTLHQFCRVSNALPSWSSALERFQFISPMQYYDHDNNKTKMPRFKSTSNAVYSLVILSIASAIKECAGAISTFDSNMIARVMHASGISDELSEQTCKLFKKIQKIENPRSKAGSLLVKQVVYDIIGAHA